MKDILAMRGKTRIMTLDKYKKEKIKLLKELGIKLTEKEQTHMDSLESEDAVDRFARVLIMNA